MTHAVIDNYLAGGLIESARATWPKESWPYWHQYENAKLASRSPYRGIFEFPKAVELILAQLAEIAVAQLLFKYEPAPPRLFPDVEFLHGAGMHQMKAGTSLGLHKDTDRHPSKPWKREATALLYLDDCEGGELDLTDASGKLQKRIGPVRNRLVLFATPAQWHRVNETLGTRRSVCLFFWSICDDGFEGDRRAVFVD